MVARSTSQLELILRVTTRWEASLPSSDPYLPQMSTGNLATLRRLYIHPTQHTRKSCRDRCNSQHRVHRPERHHHHLRAHPPRARGARAGARGGRSSLVHHYLIDWSTLIIRKTNAKKAVLLANVTPLESSRREVSGMVRLALGVPPRAPNMGGNSDCD